MHGRGAREMAVVLRVAEGSNSENELCADTEHLDHFDILENVLKGDGDDPGARSINAVHWRNSDEGATNGRQSRQYF